LEQTAAVRHRRFEILRLRELLDLAQFEPASGNLLPAGVFDSLSASSR
jgi:hypothetical protein